jgi:hypothetical protein
VKRIDANLLASLPQILQQTKKAEKIQNPAGKGRHVTIIIIIIIPQTNFFLSAGAERRRRRRSRGRWERRRLPQPKKRKENQLKICL